jgi:hypothetical protein
MAILVCAKIERCTELIMQKKILQNKKQPALIIRDRLFFLPGLIAGLILLLAAIGFAKDYTRLWPFSAIGYVSTHWALLGLIACLSAIFFHKKMEAYLGDFSKKTTEMLYLGLLIGLFIFYLVHSSVKYPFLEGDGVLNVGDAARLREYGIGFLTRSLNLDGVQTPLYDTGRVILNNPKTVSLAWKIMGILFLVTLVFGIRKLSDLPKDRTLALAFGLSLPTSLTFLGYYDNYSLNFSLLVLANMLFFLCARNRSWIFGILTVGCFILSFIAHSFSIIMGLYLFLWIVFIYAQKKSWSQGFQKAAICAVFVAMMVATIIFAHHFSTVNLLKPLGYLPARVIQKDGWFSMLVDPILLPLSFLVTYLLLCGITIYNKKSVFPFLGKESHPIEGAFYYGSFFIFISYCVIQIVSAKANLGMLDFMSQVGAVGGFFVIPSLIMVLQPPLKKYLLVFIMFNLFIVVPNMMVHKSHGQIDRLVGYLPQERAFYYNDISPYVHVGLRLARPELQDESLDVFKRGMQDRGYYQEQNGLNQLYYLAWAFEFKNDQSCYSALEQAIKTNPNMVIDLWRNGTRFTDRCNNKAYRRVRDASRQIIQNQLQKYPHQSYYKQLGALLNEFEIKNP